MHYGRVRDCLPAEGTGDFTAHAVWDSADVVRSGGNILCESTYTRAEDSIAFLESGVRRCLLYYSREIIARDEGWVDVSFSGVDVLVGSLGVEDVCVLGAAVRDADEVFVGVGLGGGDLGWFEG